MLNQWWGEILLCLWDAARPWTANKYAAFKNRGKDDDRASHEKVGASCVPDSNKWRTDSRRKSNVTTDKLVINLKI
jgi:hypothetical protein